MHKLHTLKNGLPVITIDLPHLDSVTTLIAVGAGSRYESKRLNGLSHFLEHMFFKGSQKYPSAEELATLVESVGAVNNAATNKEYTYYWIKSAADHLELAADILSSQLKESLFDAEEIEREKGVIIEEIKMYRDDPKSLVWELYDRLQFGDQPLGWDIGGEEETVQGLTRQDFLDYMKDFYSPDNMALVFVGKLPKDIDALAAKYFSDLPQQEVQSFSAATVQEQTELVINVAHRPIDQAYLVLGMEGVGRFDDRKYALNLLSKILGEGMSSRLFIQVRERRGLAYSVGTAYDTFADTGSFVAHAGLKVSHLEEGLRVIVEELMKTTTELVSDKELAKAKEMEKGRMALRRESTNFLAERFGIKYVLEKKVESFEEHLARIEAVTAEDILKVAQEIIRPDHFNLQVVGPVKNTDLIRQAIQTASNPIKNPPTTSKG